MTEQEWISNGYAMGVVEPDYIDMVTFHDMYRQWFHMKCRKVKPETVDRIECTFNRWFLSERRFLDTPCAKMDETYLVEWLTGVIIRAGNVTGREFDRIYQIIYGVLLYARDMDVKGVKLMDWAKIKRYMPNEHIIRKNKQEVAIPRKDIDALFKAVLVENIYPLKKSASLCLLANFYMGLRIGELAALEWRNVDLNRRCVHIDKTTVKYFERDENMERCAGMKYRAVEGTKTLTSVRDIPLCDEAVYLLGLLREHHDQMHYESEYLAYDGTPTILDRSLDRTLRRLCKLCDIPIYNTHKIRKTFATYLHDSRVPIKTVSALLGHADVTTTAQFYIKTDYESEAVLGEISDALKVMVDLHEN